MEENFNRERLNQLCNDASVEQDSAKLLELTQTTLDLYTDEDLDEMIAAQEKFLNAVGFEAGSVQ